MNLIDFLKQCKENLEGDDGFVLEYCDLRSINSRRIGITVRKDNVVAVYSDPRINHDLRKNFSTWEEMERWTIEFLDGKARNPMLDEIEKDMDKLKIKYAVLLKQEAERKKEGGL